MTHPIDIFVGSRVRQFRREQKLSQQIVGEAIGVRFQQIQKYETGSNRISASMLWEISKVLKIEIAQLFEGADDIEIK